MSLNIIGKKESPLLSRTVITASLDYSGVTPSTTEVQNQLASTLKANQKLVVVKDIKTGFGGHTANITAYVYDSEEEMEKFKMKVPKKLAEKLKKAEEDSKKAEEAPKEEAKAEEKADVETEEDPKGESKVEEKPEVKEESPKEEKVEEKSE